MTSRVPREWPHNERGSHWEPLENELGPINEEIEARRKIMDEELEVQRQRLASADKEPGGAMLFSEQASDIMVLRPDFQPTISSTEHRSIGRVLDDLRKNRSLLATSDRDSKVSFAELAANFSAVAPPEMKPELTAEDYLGLIKAMGRARREERWQDLIRLRANLRRLDPELVTPPSEDERRGMNGVIDWWRNEFPKTRMGQESSVSGRPSQEIAYLAAEMRVGDPSSPDPLTEEEWQSFKDDLMGHSVKRAGGGLARLGSSLAILRASEVKVNNCRIELVD